MIVQHVLPSSKCHDAINARDNDMKILTFGRMVILPKKSSGCSIKWMGF